MSEAKPYSRENNGQRFNLKGGMNTFLSPDLIPEGSFPYLQNVRSFLGNRITGRNTQSAAIVTVGAPPHSLKRMNDTTPAGPMAGYVLVIGAAGQMYVNALSVVTGMSGHPVSLVPFRPNASVQPWMYVGDSAPFPNVTVTGGYNCAGMVKIRSDGTSRKDGIKEPQLAPTVSTSNSSTTGTDALPATTVPWTNISGANASFNYGQTTAFGAGGPTAPVIISTPIVGSTVTLVITGTATVNGATHAPGDTGPATSTYPANFTGAGPKIVVGAFTDSSGVVVNPGGPVNIGASATLIVPFGATRLQIGIDSQDPASGTPSFATNTGSYSIAWTVTTSAVAQVLSTLGQVQAFVWGDSPQTGPVASYIWKNPNDSGTGTPRSSSTAPVTVSNNSWQFDTAGGIGANPTTFVQWDTLASNGSVTGELNLFAPAFAQSAPNTTNFNAAITGTLFVPVGGTYTFTLVNKDAILFGIGGGATVSGGYVTAPNYAQTETVVSGLPLVLATTPNGTGGAVTNSVSITFPAAGSYPIEIDWDFWYHAGRTLVMTASPTPGAAAAVIPPLPQGVRTDVSYAYKYRASETGAQSNPSPGSDVQVTPVLDNTITSVFSPDPQVDKVDYYRQDSGLANYTYVATGPNDGLGPLVSGIQYNTPIVDSLTDLDAADNQEMQFDDFEPFPSIDLPRKGIVNVSGGVITWVSGDQFNLRWLAGTIMEIGSPTQLPYSFIARPTSVTSVTIPGVPDGTNLAYNIAEPILAAQPLPSLWGPTDNTAYMFGCYDPLRPGTLYYTKGNMPDSAPDTNQIEVCSSSEILMNGYIIGGIGQVFSTERAWWIYPTFTTALATVSGVAGQAFNLIESVNDRGLYIRTCLCTEGGKNGFFRAKDGIYVSPSGQGSKSITDAIYNLFPHEQATGTTIPGPVVIGPYTVYPPDDTNPNAQKLSFAYGYLYYDYQDVNGNYRTLVYDVTAEGWSIDVGTPSFTIHAPIEGQANGTYIGGNDATVRTLAGGATETATSVVATGSVNAGDARAFKRLGDVFIKALIAASNPITVALYANQYNVTLAGFSPTSLTGTGVLAPYIVDFTAGHGDDLIDVAAALSWNTDSANFLELWQPTFTPLPPTIADQPSDWGNLGGDGVNFVQGIILELDTFGVAKTFSVEDEFGGLHTPNECPVTANGQQKRPFTFTPPFTSHIGRIISTDGVLWRRGPDAGWESTWVGLPYPESTVEWQTELTSINGIGWQHVRELNFEYISTTAITIAFVVDSGNGSIAPQTITVPSSGGTQTKLKLIPTANKFKLLSIRASSSSPFSIWIEGMQLKARSWGESSPYRIERPFGGPSSTGASV